MLSGHQPFRGENLLSISNAILDSQPAALSGASSSAQGVVSRALNKNGSDRYQAVAELLGDLRTATSHAAGVVTEPEMPSIAVLPFADMSPQKDQDYFCEGMAEELINALTNLEGLHVSARTSSFKFKGQAVDAIEIGTQLKVASILEGSVRKAGNRIRITAQLIKVSDGFHLWSERYDRDLDDVFAVQDEIAQAIVDKLRIKLAGESPATLVKPPTNDLEAYSLYLQGRYRWNRRTPEDLEKALSYFEQTVAKDPRCALGFVGIADVYNVMPAYSPVRSTETLTKAKAAIATALDLDDTLAEAHASAGWQCFHSWEWSVAEREFRRALSLNPKYATTYLWYAHYLAVVHRSDEAVASIRRAQALEPLSLIVNTHVGVVLRLVGRPREAIPELRRALAMEPNFVPAHEYLAGAYDDLGMSPEAIAEAETAAGLAKNNPMLKASLAMVYARAGRTTEAIKIVKDLEESNHPYSLAMGYLALGKLDQAFTWFDRSLEDHDFYLTYLPAFPGLSAYRASGLESDPRFQALLRRMHFPETAASN